MMTFVQVGTSTTTTFNDTGLTEGPAQPIGYARTDAAGNFSPIQHNGNCASFGDVSGLVAA